MLEKTSEPSGLRSDESMTSRVQYRYHAGSAGSSDRMTSGSAHCSASFPPPRSRGSGLLYVAVAAAAGCAGAAAIAPTEKASAVSAERMNRDSRRGITTLL